MGEVLMPLCEVLKFEQKIIEIGGKGPKIVEMDDLDGICISSKGTPILLGGNLFQDIHGSDGDYRGELGINNSAYFFPDLNATVVNRDNPGYEITTRVFYAAGNKPEDLLNAFEEVYQKPPTKEEPVQVAEVQPTT